MKRKYKYIYFEKGEENHWTCHNNKSGVILGDIFIYSPWRAYCFFPATDHEMVLSADCLRDIADFLEQLNKERQR